MLNLKNQRNFQNGQILGLWVTLSAATAQITQTGTYGGILSQYSRIEYFALDTLFQGSDPSRTSDSAFVKTFRNGCLTDESFKIVGNANRILGVSEDVADADDPNNYSRGTSSTQHELEDRPCNKKTENHIYQNPPNFHPRMFLFIDEECMRFLVESHRYGTPLPFVKAVDVELAPEGLVLRYYGDLNVAISSMSFEFSDLEWT